MRVRDTRLLALVFALALSATAESPTDAYISGTTRDCFGSRKIRPAGADIYLIDPKAHPRISRLLDKMHEQMRRKPRSALALERSTAEFLSAVKQEKSLPRTESSRDGTFEFQHLRADHYEIVLGIPKQKGYPAYYRLEEWTLTAGKNSVVLDFNADQPCN